MDEAPGAPECWRVLSGPLGIPVLVGLTGQADVGMGTTHLKSFWSQILLSKAGRVTGGRYVAAASNTEPGRATANSRRGLYTHTH